MWLFTYIFSTSSFVLYNSTLVACGYCIQIRTVGVDDKHQTVQGLTFPFEEAALQQLQQMAAGHLNFVQLVRFAFIYTFITSAS